MPARLTENVGRTPPSAPDPLVRLFVQQADRGVGRGPGDPPHKIIAGCEGFGVLQ